jgi:hypothetical protein
MNRAVSGTLTVQESGRPLPGMQVVAARLVPGGVELLGACISGDMGRFFISYEPLPEPADLFLLVYSPDGRQVYTESMHRCITGAELRLAVQVPRTALVADMH